MSKVVLRTATAAQIAASSTVIENGRVIRCSDQPFYVIGNGATALNQLTHVHDNTGFQVQDKTSLSAKVTAIGASRANLIIDSSQNVTADLVIPKNITPVFVGDGDLDVDDTFTVTIQGFYTADPLRQIFTGLGDVVTSDVQKNVVHWGAVDDTESSTVVQKIIDAYSSFQLYVPENFTLKTYDHTAIDKTYVGLWNDGIIKKVEATGAAARDDSRYLLRVVDATDTELLKVGKIRGDYDYTTFDGATKYDVADKTERNALTGLVTGDMVYVGDDSRWSEYLGTGSSGSYVDNDFREVWGLAFAFYV